MRARSLLSLERKGARFIRPLLESKTNHLSVLKKRKSEAAAHYYLRGKTREIDLKVFTRFQDAKWWFTIFGQRQSQDSVKNRRGSPRSMPPDHEGVNPSLNNDAIMGQLQSDDHHQSLQQGEEEQQQQPNDAVVPLAGTEASSVLFVDHQVSPGISECWLGAEVQVENKIARRCSYEEMVHEEAAEEAIMTTSEAAELPQEDAWYQAVLRVTQWAITLQEVHDERKGGCQISSKCLCAKASAIGQKLSNLTNVMLSTEARENDHDQDNFDLLHLVDDVQSALRAGVSIQISKPSEAVISKAVSVVDAAMVSCDKAAYIRSAIDSIVKLVDGLLNVPTCSHANNSNLLDDSDRIRDVSPTRLMEQDEEEDIRSRVASMFQDDEDSEDEEEDEMDTGSSPRVARKRKQFLKNGRSLTSPTSSPSKRPRKLKSPILPTSPLASTASPLSSTISMSAPAKICQTTPALDLLESKKKVQRNSLYHWVLWREALRGEKDRANHPRARLSFN